MEIIDFHTHPGYNTTKDFGYDMTPELFVNELKRAGITRACGSALDLEMIKSEPKTDVMIKKLNHIAWMYYEKFPDFFVPGIHIHPECIDVSANEIEFYSKKGVKIIGELTPYLMNCDTFLSMGYFELFELCCRKDMILSLHRPPINECVSLAEKFPSLKMVIAHPSYGKDYADMLSVIKKYENLFLDLSGTGIAAYGMLRYGVDVVGKEKLLFGTDFPGYNPEMYVRSVLYERLADDETDYIFHKNAEALLAKK